MSKRRWSLWLAPPIAIAVVALALSRFLGGAEAGPKTTPVAEGACAHSPIARSPAGKPDWAGGVGTWWKLSEKLDARGVFRGRELALGKGGGTNLVLEYAPETLVSGPTGGLVVVTTDDGEQSEIRLVSITAACSWVLHRTPDVVRGAILDPSDGSVLAHVLGRNEREDLGTWRFGAGGGTEAPTMVAGAVPIQLIGGRVFSTDLRLDAASATLAVQSCTDAGCVTRLFGLAAPADGPVVLADAHGDLIGFAQGRLFTWAACVGLPCAIESWALDGSGHTTVVDPAEYAGLTADGRFLTATRGANPGGVTRFDLVGGTSAAIRGVNRDERFAKGGVHGLFGIEVELDGVGLAAPRANPRSFRPAAAEVIR